MAYQPKPLEMEGIGTRPVQEDITVVIPTLGRPILEECLYWIVAGSKWPGSLIVVDQGASQQATAWIDTLRSLGINARHLPSSRRGRAAGLNLGLESVETRFVAVTDDDCFVEHDWLESMKARLCLSPDMIVTGRVEPAGPSESEFCVVKSLSPKVYYRPQVRGHPLIGGNMGVSMANVMRVGSFDEHPCLSSAEDADWGYRALRLTIPIIYDPDIVVRHFGWRSADERAQRYREYSRSQGGFYGKHLLSGDGLIALQAMRDVLRGPIRWARGSIYRDRDMIDRGRSDTVELVPGIVAGLRRRSSL